MHEISNLYKMVMQGKDGQVKKDNIICTAMNGLKNINPRQTRLNL